MSSAEENKALVNRFIEAQNKGDLETLDDLLAPDFVDHSLLPGQVPGREGFTGARLPSWGRWFRPAYGNRRGDTPATFIVVIGTGLFYVFVSWMAIAGNGLEQSVSVAKEDPFALFFDPTREYNGGWAVVLFQWLIITGSYACGMAFHNCASRICMP